MPASVLSSRVGTQSAVSGSNRACRRAAGQRVAQPANVPSRSRQQHVCRVLTTTQLQTLSVSIATTSTVTEVTGWNTVKLIELCTDWVEAKKATNDWKRQQDTTDAIRAAAGNWATAMVEQLKQTWSTDEEPARADVIERLAVVIWQAYSLDDQTFLKERLALLKELQPVLTAGEQIVLFERVPGTVRLTPEELYDFATAYLAEGYRLRRNSLIDTAERLFMSAIQIADLAKRWWGWGLPAPVVKEAYLARATCNILLNRFQLAERLLETGGQSLAKVQNAAFRSEADTAMYMIAERVMNEDVFALYTEYKNYRADLEKWVNGRNFPLTYLGQGTPPKAPGWNDPSYSQGGLKSVDEALKSFDEVSSAAFGAVKSFFKF